MDVLFSLFMCSSRGVKVCTSSLGFFPVCKWRCTRGSSVCCSRSPRICVQGNSPVPASPGVCFGDSDFFPLKSANVPTRCCLIYIRLLARSSCMCNYKMRFQRAREDSGRARTLFCGRTNIWGKTGRVVVGDTKR